MSDTNIPKSRKPRATKPPKSDAPIDVPAPKSDPAPSLVGGLPFTLDRIRAAYCHIDANADAMAAQSGVRGFWKAARKAGLVSLSRIGPGPELSSWLVRSIMTGGHASAKIAAERAGEWADRVRKADADGSHRQHPKAEPGYVSDRINAIMAGGNRPLDPIVNRVSAIAYVCNALSTLPAWVLNAPIPDALREPGSAEIVLRAEALAAMADGAADASADDAGDDSSS